MWHLVESLKIKIMKCACSLPAAVVVCVQLSQHGPSYIKNIDKVYKKTGCMSYIKTAAKARHTVALKVKNIGRYKEGQLIGWEKH